LGDFNTNGIQGLPKWRCPSKNSWASFDASSTPERSESKSQRLEPLKTETKLPISLLADWIKVICSYNDHLPKAKLDSF
jgi:hypothetical protein